MNIDIIKKLTVWVLCVVLILCFVSCSQVNNGDTPDVPSETKIEEPKETEINDETSAPETKEWPIIETPEINNNEIVWSKAPMIHYPLWLDPGEYDWSLLLPDYVSEFVGELDDEKWYCVEVVCHNYYVKEIVVKSKDNWPDGIDADGKLTALIDDYNAKYDACREYLKGHTADEINEALSDDAYSALRQSAHEASSAFFKHCNSYFDNIQKQLQDKADSVTTYTEALQASYALTNHKKIEKAFWDDIELEDIFPERMKLLGFFEYEFENDTSEEHYVAKGKDLKALPDRVQAIDGFGVYWSVNHDSEEWN